MTVSGIDPAYHNKQMLIAVVRISKVELVNEYFWEWIRSNSSEGTVEKISETTSKIGYSAELKFQKKLGSVMKDFGVENPL